MILLTWVIFWLSLYNPLHFYAAAPFRIVDEALPAGLIGGAYWCQVGHDCHEERIVIDMAQINARADYGPWDRVVMAACKIAHEQAHVRAKSADEVMPLAQELICLDKMPNVDQRLKDWVVFQLMVEMDKLERRAD